MNKLDKHDSTTKFEFGAKKIAKLTQSANTFLIVINKQNLLWILLFFVLVKN